MELDPFSPIQTRQEEEEEEEEGKTRENKQTLFTHVFTHSNPTGLARRRGDVLDGPRSERPRRV